MAEQGVYLGNPNLKKANVSQEWTKKLYYDCVIG